MIRVSVNEGVAVELILPTGGIANTNNWKFDVEVEAGEVTTRNSKRSWNKIGLRTVRRVQRLESLQEETEEMFKEIAKRLTAEGI
jgi:hypothetical protein